MNYYLYRMIPRRPSFMTDMSPDAGATMDEHFEYWAGVIAQRKVVAYGQGGGGHPAGAYGIAVLEVAYEREARQLVADDPAAKSGFGSELHPMPDTVVRGSLPAGPVWLPESVTRWAVEGCPCHRRLAPRPGPAAGVRPGRTIRSAPRERAFG
jgi:hypothetical protein